MVIALPDWDKQPLLTMAGVPVSIQPINRAVCENYWFRIAGRYRHWAESKIKRQCKLEVKRGFFPWFVICTTHSCIITIPHYNRFKSGIAYQALSPHILMGVQRSHCKWKESLGTRLIKLSCLSTALCNTCTCTCTWFKHSIFFCLFSNWAWLIRPITYMWISKHTLNEKALKCMHYVIPRATLDTTAGSSTGKTCA